MTLLADRRVQPVAGRLLGNKIKLQEIATRTAVIVA
jgi:hypothetical protein